MVDGGKRVIMNVVLGGTKCRVRRPLLHIHNCACTFTIIENMKVVYYEDLAL